MGEEETSPFLLNEDGDDKEPGRRRDRKPAISVTSIHISSPEKKKWLMVVLGVVAVCVFAVFVLTGVLIGVFGFKGSTTSTHSPIYQEICANPPLLLISLDGFRAEYLKRNITPTLMEFINADAKRIRYMRSSFPTLTFPNHYSIVTGLYPESHGIVNNHFYDIELKKRFSFKETDSRWWKGEPIWVTAAKNKLKSGIYFWPGSEAEIEGIRPDYYFPYDGSVPFNDRVDKVLEWLDLPKDKRPQFLAVYISEPDHTGHLYGPDSAEVNATLIEVDDVIARLWTGLKKKSISECVNIIIVSDHGMAALNTSKVVHLEQTLPPHLAKSRDVLYRSYGPVMNIDVTKGKESLVEDLYNAFVQNGTEKGLPFRVFYTKDLPFRLHAGHFNKQRYGPLYLLADVDAYLIPPNRTTAPSLGNHGYDNIEKDIEAIFISRGPAFGQYYQQMFENVQLYSLMCDLLNITASSNNGTYGALHDTLNWEFKKHLPQPTTPGGSQGVNDTCPFPMDNDTLVSRSICSECVCSDSCGANDDAILESSQRSFNLTDEEVSRYQNWNFPWGVPEGGRGDGACVLTQPDFVTLYSNTLRIPLFLGYRPVFMTPYNVTSTDVCHRRDPRLEPANSANCSLYNFTISSDLVEREAIDLETGDADPLVPVSWILPMDETKDILSESVLSAIVPLRKSFVEKVWKPLRLALADWIVSSRQIVVIMGSVLDADRDGLRDPDSSYPNLKEGVAIPSHLFVVLTRCASRPGTDGWDPGDLEVLSMLFQHPLESGDYMNGRDILRYGLTSIRDIEKVTGLNFYPNLSASQQNYLELRLNNDLWPTTSL